MPEKKDATIDPKRELDWAGCETGVKVRARDSTGKVVTTDAVYLDAESLLIFLRSRGGQNLLAENMVGILLGHGHLHGPTKGGE